MMKILISGASGLIGSALSEYLRQQHYEVVHLVRTELHGNAGEIYWSPVENKIDESRLEGFDAVVHLAGENIAEGKWTDEKKERMYKSRVQGTQLLSTALAGLQKPPSVFISTSAVGVYGDRGDEQLSERASSGSGFIAELCVKWEEATKPAKEVGIRVIVSRFGMVLTTKGGALARMLPPFKAGLGGKIGNGRQYVSWITMTDCLRALEFLIKHNRLSGPINIVAPEPVTNAEFVKVLGKVLHRPSRMGVPRFIVRRMFGEMADELLLSSIRVIPERLTGAGFQFQHPDIETALRHVLKKEQMA